MGIFSVANPADVEEKYTKYNRIIMDTLRVSNIEFNEELVKERLVHP